MPDKEADSLMLCVRNTNSINTIENTPEPPMPISDTHSHIYRRAPTTPRHARQQQQRSQQTKPLFVRAAAESPEHTANTPASEAACNSEL